MRKSFKKVIASVLVTAMAFSTSIVVDSTKVSAASLTMSTAIDEGTELIGQSWWKPENDTIGGIPLENGVAQFFVEAKEDSTYFIVEVRDGNACLTTSCQSNGWAWDDVGTPEKETTGTVTAGEVQNGLVKAGHLYKITVVCQKDNNGTEDDDADDKINFTVDYYDMTENQPLFTTIKLNDTNMTENSTVNITAEVGAFKVGKYYNPVRNKSINGTGWWNGPNENSDVYYVGPDSSVDIYAAHTGGSTGIVLESATAEGYIDVNLQSADSIRAPWGAAIETNSLAATAGFPQSGVVRISLSRNGQDLGVTIKNVATDEEIGSGTLALKCPQDEVLGFYLMATDGSFYVTPSLAGMEGMDFYNISSYRGETYTAPIKEGYIFAGWYEDAAYTTPIGTDVITGYAYAKFVDAALLATKCQTRAGTSAESSTADLRMMLAVDSLKYRNVGFDIEYDGAKYNGESRTVYESISVTDNGTTVSFDPATVFGTSTAKYMLSCILTDIPQANFSKEINVTPYWTTLDGTKVTGGTRTVTIQESFQ